MPVFIQFRQDQEIKTEGQGDLFVIYEDDGVHYSGAEDEDENTIHRFHGNQVLI